MISLVGLTIKSEWQLMIPTFTDYIDNYISLNRARGLKTPGEHHFVAAYLLPLLHGVNKTVPDYVNPDGTKGVLGDVVYFENGKHLLSIEVKFETIRLTKNEYNTWIVNDDPRHHPDIFVGIGTKGIVVLPWSGFRKAYISATKKPSTLTKGYGPMKQVNVLGANLEGGFIQKGELGNTQLRQEKRFIKKLTECLEDNDRQADLAGYLGQQIARNLKECTADWDDRDFVDYFWETTRQEGEVIRRVNWGNGSMAGVTRYQEFYCGYDEAQRYGPFEKYENVISSGLDLSSLHDRIVEDWTHPDFA